MQRPNSVWQKCSENWQSAFIRENIMLLGHTAWKGYLADGPGLVACKVAVGEATILNPIGDVMRDNALYIPNFEAVDYLSQNDLNAQVINRLMNKVRTYRPEREILVFVERKGEINISLLTNLAIAPADCYQQVCNRWEEFYLEPRSAGGRL